MPDPRDAELLAALAEHMKEDPDCAKPDFNEADLQGEMSDALRENIYSHNEGEL